MAKKQATTKPKVLIALTAQRMMFARTTAALLNAAIANKNQEFELDFYMEMGCEIASARNRIARVAKEREATHLLFVDYDMYFPSDAIAKLLKADKDIIGAAYNTRGDGSRPTAVPLEEPAPQDQPFKCHAMGTGLLLIKTSVFDKLAAPWFMWGFTPEGTLHFGEDTYFCQRAINEAGLEVWADPTLGVKHIGEHLF